MSRKSGALTYPEPLGPPRPVIGDLYRYMFQVTVPIIRRNNRIYATLGICHSVWMTVWSSTQSDKYQVLHRYSYFSWWWAHSCPKHVEKKINKLRKSVHQFIYRIIQGCTVNKT